MRRTATVLLFLAGTASAAITGSVLDEDGKPLSGATVHAFAAEPSRPYRLRLIHHDFNRQPLASAKTGADGSFRINPKAAAVDLVFEMPGREMPTIGTVDGEELGALVVPRIKSRFTVMADGKPVPNAVVVYSRVVALKTDAQGQIPDVWAASGKLVEHPDYAPVGVSGYETEAQLNKGVLLRGRVVNANGGVGHAMIFADWLAIGETAEDGSFSIEHAPAEMLNRVTAVGEREIGIVSRTGNAPLDIRLGPALVASGRALDMKGAPVVGARLDLKSQNSPFSEMV